jgi:hypothetical protein
MGLDTILPKDRNKRNHSQNKRVLEHIKKNAEV